MALDPYCAHGVAFIEEDRQVALQLRPMKRDEKRGFSHGALAPISDCCFASAPLSLAQWGKSKGSDDESSELTSAASSLKPGNDLMSAKKALGSILGNTIFGKRASPGAQRSKGLSGARQITLSVDLAEVISTEVYISVASAPGYTGTSTSTEVVL